MSTWHEIKDVDIDIDEKSKEVNILVDGNDFGNNYVTMTYDQINEIYLKINDHKG